MATAVASQTPPMRASASKVVLRAAGGERGRARGWCTRQVDRTRQRTVTAVLQVEDSRAPRGRHARSPHMPRCRPGRRSGPPAEARRSLRGASALSSSAGSPRRRHRRPSPRRPS
jgi:hypothetical protein